MALLFKGIDVQLIWNDNSSDELGFLLERSVDNETDYETLFFTAADVTEFIDTGLERGHSYFYRISAFNDNGYSPFATTQASIVTGITKQEPHIFFSPNPVVTHMYVTTDTTPLNIVVINQLGQPLINLISHEKEISVDLSPLPSGPYILKLTSRIQSDSHLVIKH